MSVPADPKLRRLMRTLPDFEGSVRVRVGGLLFAFREKTTSVLLVEHAGIWTDDPFWTPPGGGVEFGESLEDALQREVKEETNLEVEVGPLRYVLDFIRAPLHAVSFYFECRTSGDVHEISTGFDPEIAERQLIKTVRMVSFEELEGKNVYPEGLEDWLPVDVGSGFPNGVRHIGTLR